MVIPLHLFCMHKNSLHLTKFHNKYWRRNFKSTTINTVFGNKATFLKCLNYSKNKREIIALSECIQDLLMQLTEFLFFFYCFFISFCFILTDILHNQFQSKNVDDVKANMAIMKFNKTFLSTETLLWKKDLQV